MNVAALECMLLSSCVFFFCSSPCLAVCTDVCVYACMCMYGCVYMSALLYVQFTFALAVARLKCPRMNDGEEVDETKERGS